VNCDQTVTIRATLTTRDGAPVARVPLLLRLRIVALPHLEFRRFTNGQGIVNIEVPVPSTSIFQLLRIPLPSQFPARVEFGGDQSLRRSSAEFPVTITCQ
jgi:hypothetical protein